MPLNEKISKKLEELLMEDCYKDYELQLDNLAKKLSLSIFDATFTDPKLSGVIYKDKDTGKFSIYVNETHPITRKRFTVAHEIGHYISAICESYSKEQLFKEGFEDYAVLYRKEGGNSLAEKEANQIAADMLMPAKWVQRFLEDGISIEKMAKIFFVSREAMAIRVDNLGITIL